MAKVSKRVAALRAKVDRSRIYPLGDRSEAAAFSISSGVKSYLARSNGIIIQPFSNRRTGPVSGKHRKLFCGRLQK